MTTSSSTDEQSHSGAAPGLLERGRASYVASAWQDAYDALSSADALCPLGGEDLQLLTGAAALTARDTEMLAALERLFQLHLAQGNEVKAARAAFWLGYRLMSLGEVGRSNGWLGRATRLVENQQQGSAEQGYLMLPMARRQLADGDLDAAEACISQAIRIGNRVDEPDLVALANSWLVRILLRKGKLQQGLTVLDEVMLSATRRELSPLVAGLVYCSTIATCQRVYALDRAREWTVALTEWCDRQPQLVMFAGPCLVHRAEIMELSGEWGKALVEAQRASDRIARSRDPDSVAADAFYRQAEIFRLRGEFEAAERAYRHTSLLGREPQPGLALLRLAQGNKEVAVGALRRLVGSTRDDLQRTRFLPAYVDSLLAVGDTESAKRACEDLQVIASGTSMPVLTAIADHAHGAVLLACDDAQSAVTHLRAAFRLWHELGAPYIAARIRLLIGCACRTLGDEDSARLEFDSAREVFTRLGAEPDRATAEELSRGRTACHHRGLTPRELQVLRLVATGKTNKVIAAELHLSEKTVDRHVNNIFSKIDVSSRAAATAHAYENKLL